MKSKRKSDATDFGGITGYSEVFGLYFKCNRKHWKILSKSLT